MYRRPLSALAAALLLLATFVAAPREADAQGFIIVDEPATEPQPRHRRPIQRYMPLEVREHHVSVDIASGVASTSIDQTFYNPTGARLEGTFIFPIPAGAEIDEFEMDVNGTMTPAELLDATKARGIYEEIVRKAQDPALMEYCGQGMFKVRIFPIEPRSEKRVKVKYTQVLKRDGRITGYVYPLDTKKYSARPVKSVSLKATIDSKSALKSIYSPTHDIDISRKGNRRAIIGFEQSDALPDSDFQLFFATETKKGAAVGLELLTYRDPNGKDGSDGYYMMLVSPGAWKAAKRAPKDVVFAVDTSGSMRVEKLDQAKAALAFCIGSLDEGDRFEIVRYSTEAEPLFDGLRPANKTNIAEAQEFIENLRAGGGTAIEEALLMGVGHAAGRKDATRPYQLIFLTDGRPTIGETRPEKILERLGGALEEVASTVRVFSFGIGTDINTKLLDRIANETRAATEYVLPTEDLELKVSRLYAKIAEPVMTDLKVRSTGGVRLSQRHPGELPDLFKGDQLVVFGRYTPSKKKDGKAAPAIVLEGTLDGERNTFRYPVTFAKKSKDRPFIPRLWATRRVGFLLDQIRLSGEKAELKDEVVTLARRWGIVTPYTSYLIIEDEEARAVPLARQTVRSRGISGQAGATPDPAESSARLPERAAFDALLSDESGDGAVAASQSSKELKKATSTAAAGRAYMQSRYEGAKLDLAPQPTRHIAGKTFYQNDGTWTDSTAAAITTEPVHVSFGSPEYFDLFADDPQIARWLSLGDHMQIVIGDTLYQIAPTP